MANLDEFRNADGNIDWKALKQAEIENGECCYKCDTTLWFKKGYRTLCTACSNLCTSPNEVSSEDFIRCPKCQHQWRPYDYEQYHVMKEGEHSITCPECENSFELSTTVTYLYTSPAVSNP